MSYVQKLTYKEATKALEAFQSVIKELGLTRPVDQSQRRQKLYDDLDKIAAKLPSYKGVSEVVIRPVVVEVNGRRTEEIAYSLKASNLTPDGRRLFDNLQDIAKTQSLKEVLGEIQEIDVEVVGENYVPAIKTANNIIFFPNKVWFLGSEVEKPDVAKRLDNAIKLLYGMSPEVETPR